jgi:hypothetical protein
LIDRHSSPSRPQTTRRAIYGTIFAILAVTVSVPFMSDRTSEWDDVYAAAANRLAQGEDLYPLHTNYTYPPFMAGVAYGVEAFGPTLGRAIWLAINLIAVAFMIRWGWWLAGGRNWPDHPHDDAIFFLGLLCGLRYILNGFSHLQTDIVIASLMIGGAVAVARGRSIASGLAFGLATAIKGPAFLWMGYLLYRRQFRSAGVMVAVILLASLLPDLIHSEPTGSIWLARWFQAKASLVVRDQQYPGVWASAIENNQSISGLVCRGLVGQWQKQEGEYLSRVVPSDSITPRGMKSIIYAIESALAIATLVGFIRAGRLLPSTRRWAIEASLVLTLIVLVSPMSSKPHFASMLLPGWVLARGAIEREYRSSAGWLMLALFGLNLGWNFWGNDVEFFALWIGAVTLGTAALWAGLLVLLLFPATQARQMTPTIDATTLRRAA